MEDKRRRYRKVAEMGKSIPTLNAEQITLADLIAVKKFRLKNQHTFDYSDLLDIKGAPELARNGLALLIKLDRERVQLKNTLMQLEQQVLEALFWLSFCIVSDETCNEDLLTEYSLACQKLYARELNQVRFYPADIILKFSLKNLFHDAYVPIKSDDKEKQLLESVEQNTKFLQDKFELIMSRLKALADSGNDEAQNKIDKFAKYIKENASEIAKSAGVDLAVWLQATETTLNFELIESEDMDDFVLISDSSNSIDVDSAEEPDEDIEPHPQPVSQEWKGQISRRDLMDLSQAAKRCEAEADEKSSTTFKAAFFMQDFRRQLNSNNQNIPSRLIAPTISEPEPPKPAKTSDDSSSDDDSLSYSN